MPARRPALVLAVAACALAPAAPAAVAAHTPAPRLAGLRCVPASTAACARGVQVGIGRQVQLRGTRLVRGMRVTFRWPLGALATKLHRGRAGWVVRVPPGVRAGKVGVTVRDRAGRRSNPVAIRVLAPPAPTTVAAPRGSLPAAFRGNGMWIWQLPKSAGGDLDAIAARAASAQITTVLVKAGDGPTAWPQFSPVLVGGLHQRGLRACAWQFVYGDDPQGEAAVGAAAVSAGADCLVIDAEGQYGGKYAAAQTYLTALRSSIGPDYPLGFTSFPYIDYHPKIPYSVFLGPGGAQVNLPQVYWKDIGGTVDAVSAHAFAHNRIYGAPIAPIGQAYAGPAPDDVRRFRGVWAGYGTAGMSWWSWQAADDTTWATLAEPAPAAAVPSDPGWPMLGKGSKGDEVIWLQQHLATGDPTVAVSGAFDAATDAAVRRLQTDRGIPVSGTTDAATWQAALAAAPRPVDWTAAPPAATAARRQK